MLPQNIQQSPETTLNWMHRRLSRSH
jgi:hypothetical protein